MAIGFYVRPSNGEIARELGANPEELFYILSEMAEEMSAGDKAELAGYLENQATPQTAELLRMMAEAAAK